MSESPTYSDPEKHASVSDEKVVYAINAPVYVDDGNEEADAVEFGEVKELRYVLIFLGCKSPHLTEGIVDVVWPRDTFRFVFSSFFLLSIAIQEAC